MIKLTQDEFGVLCLCALRYCHGRMTYMPSLIQSIVLQHKDELSDKDRACILQDKDFQRRCDLWGSDIDRTAWERFYERLGEQRKQKLNRLQACRWTRHCACWPYIRRRERHRIRTTTRALWLDIHAPMLRCVQR